MKNLIKADFLRLKYSKTWTIPIILTLLMFIIYAFDGDAQFVSSGNVVFGQGIGFISSVEKAEIMNIIRSSMSYNIFLILIIFMFSIHFYTSQYSQNTIKLSIANGENRFKIYLSKIIVITIFSFFIYYLLSYTIFIFNSIRFNFIPTIDEILLSFKILTVNFLIIEILILLSVFICILLKRNIFSTMIIFLFLFIGMMLYMNVWSNINSQTLIMKLFLKINPIYYISTISACNFNNNILNESLFYFVLGSVILFSLSYFLIRKEEIR